LRVGHLELGQKSNAPRHALEFRGALGAEQNRAGIASADYFSDCRIDQVLMLAGQLGATQLASFYSRPFARELTQRRKRAIFLRTGSKRQGHTALR
jgi:hypothetical protein